MLFATAAVATSAMNDAAHREEKNNGPRKYSKNYYIITVLSNNYLILFGL